MKIIHSPDGYMAAFRNDYGKDICIVLIDNNWDDFGYKTTKSIGFWDGNKLIDLTTIKIIGDQDISLSMGDSINYDERIYDLLEEKILFDVFSTLKDVIFLDYCKKNTDFKYISIIDYEIEKNLELQKSEIFEKSLLRDINYNSFYKDVVSIVYSHHINPSRFNFDTKFQFDGFSGKHEIKFKFDDDFFPSNISILIGKNGVGKTQTLKHISEGFAKEGLFNILDGQKQEDSFSKIPSFRKIVTIASSSSEDFFDGDSKILKHCNFSSSNEMNYYRDFFLEILKYDLNASEFKRTKLKLNTLYSTLKLIIPKFEYIGFIPSEPTNTYSNNLKDIFSKEKDLYYIKNDYNKEFLKELSRDKKMKIIRATNVDIKEIIFLDSNYESIVLSSGQTIFLKLIFSVLAYIEKESILLFDEPEAYLHPNAEVMFMRFLKKILKDFSSYSIIGTHSTIITREVPSILVKIFHIDEKGTPNIFEPKIQTLGANIELITNIIFENLLEEKPYENWLKEKFSTKTEIDDVLANYSDKLNPEMLMYIRNEIIKK